MKIIKFLKELPEWNELIKLPGKVKELEERLSKLENPNTSFDSCPKCKKSSYELISTKPATGTRGRAGVVIRTYKCSECNHSEDKLITPNNQ